MSGVYSAMVTIVWLNLLVVNPAFATDTKEGLYFQSTRLLQEKKYEAAASAFQRLNALLVKEQKSHKKGSKPWHMLTLGQCDAMLYLAELAWLQGNKQDACLQRQAISKKMRELPKLWQRWNTNRKLKKRLLSTTAFLNQQCAAVASFLTIRRNPPNARISYLSASGKWLVLKGTRISTTQKSLQLKVEATGFLPQNETVALLRWREKRISIALKPIPPKVIIVLPRRRLPRRVAPIKRPKPPPPITEKWWFWTIVGAGVVGVGVTAVAIAVSTAEVHHVWEGNQGTKFRLWQP